jgi:hypothetical protein
VEMPLSGTKHMLRLGIVSVKQEKFEVPVLRAGLTKKPRGLQPRGSSHVLFREKCSEKLPSRESEKLPIRL